MSELFKIGNRIGPYSLTASALSCQQDLWPKSSHNRIMKDAQKAFHRERCSRAGKFGVEPKTTFKCILNELLKLGLNVVGKIFKSRFHKFKLFARLE